jgi:hypothetical protein
MRIRVINGTPLHGISLCDTCVHAKIRRGARLSDAWNGCDEMPGRIPQPVVECSAYGDKRLRCPAEYDRQAFRFVLSVGKFLPSVEWHEMQRQGKLTAQDY